MIACMGSRPESTRSSKALSSAAESLPPGAIIGSSSVISSPHSGDSSTASRARIKLTLP